LISNRLCVCTTEAAYSIQAQALAAQLEQPYNEDCAIAAQRAEWLLCFSQQGLSLQDNLSKTQIRVDFVSGAVAHRRRFGGGRGQVLARAVGLKPGRIPTIIDATAGLGRDAFVFASLGCQVQLLERSAIIAALLKDGLQRAQNDSEIGTWVKQRLHMQHSDALIWLQNLNSTQAPDVIYLDPMYPERKKTALVKKEMRLLQQLLGKDEDSQSLLEVALQVARRRVVVKRPKGAPLLNTRQPHLNISSKNTRFDIYLTHP